MMSSFPLVLLMRARREELIAAIAGLKATGVPLVGLNGGGHLYAAGYGDNLGLYFFGSLIARATGLSAEGAATLFFYAILGAAILVGGWGWWRYARSTGARLLFIAAMVPLTWIAVHFGDDYILLASLPIACVPPLLALWRRGAPSARWIWAMLLTGLAAGAGSTVRAEAGVIVCAFAAVLVLARTRVPRRQRALHVGMLLLAASLPVLGMRAAQMRRDAYLARAVPTYDPPPPAHVIWHSMYIGFGFLANDRGLEYKDEVAGKLVERVAPGSPAYSRRYNAVVRNAVLELVLQSPAFIARTLFGKLGILLMYVVVFGNIGLIAAVRARKPAALDLAFLAAVVVAGLPGVLIFPVLNYMEGFTTLLVLYALTSIDWALAAGRRPQ